MLMSLCRKLVRVVPLILGAAWVVYREHSCSNSGSLMLLVMCIGGALVFGLTAISLLLSGDGVENLF